jgi:rhodanese-related sulfurtransferase
MKSSSSKLGAEIALIFLLAAAAGFAWNHRLLSDALSGKAVQATQKSVPSTQQGTTPLPLGLMQVKELYDRKDALIVDARDNPSFAAGHIRGALSLPLGEVDARLATFRAKAPPTATIVVYCNGFNCHDSMDLGSRLLGAGYRKVFVFLGGYPEWRDAGYPTAEGTP